VTLVCSVTKPYPLLLGDLAITSQHRSRAFRGPLPTLGKALGPHAKVGGRYLTGFTQKVCILGPRLAIAWADSPHAARVVLEAARERYGSTGVEGSEIGGLLQQLGYNAGKIGKLGLSIVGMSLVDDYTVNLFSFGDGLIQDHAKFGLLRVSGSGTKHLIDKLTDDRTDIFGLHQTKENTAIHLNELHYTITNMLMYMRSRKMNDGIPRSIEDDVSLYVIPPILREANSTKNYEIKDFRNMESRVMVSCFIYTEKRPIDYWLRIDHGDSAIKIITQQDRKGKWFGLEWKPAYFDCLKSEPPQRRVKGRSITPQIGADQTARLTSTHLLPRLGCCQYLACLLHWRATG
jgi:hypothetical protein